MEYLPQSGGAPQRTQSAGARRPRLAERQGMPYGGAASTAKPGTAPAALAGSGSTVFVHFIPPPLRALTKKDLPWIVHTCSGSGCSEARHVTFSSAHKFSTFEGAPPEQTCDCAIANHHLRGVGTVRWEGDHAIVEDSEVAGANVLASLAHEAEISKLGSSLSRARKQIKALQASEVELKGKLAAAQRAQQQGKPISVSW